MSDTNAGDKLTMSADAPCRWEVRMAGYGSRVRRRNISEKGYQANHRTLPRRTRERTRGI
jgi:hypothetical protein